VAFDEETGNLLNIKTPTTPKNPEKGVMEAVDVFLREYDPDSIKMIGHATTIATNTLLGQVDLEVPVTALITTKGFRDVIEIGRQRRSEVYNLFFQKPPTLVERRHRYEVEERISHLGSIEAHLLEDDLKPIILDMKQNKVASVAIGFLNSYVNPIHEKKASNLVSHELPGVFVTSSHEISNEYREYERLSTAVVNAALLPVIHRYLDRLDNDLKASE
jgi:N-methylhydantoinase A